MSKQYKFDEIPKNFKTTVYTHYCYHSPYSWMVGTISHDDDERAGDSYICIAKTEVKIKVPEQKVDIKKLAVEALQKEKEKQMAEHHKKMFELQEKIDSLLCLEYQPTGENHD
jgi:hypothetical protein